MIFDKYRDGGNYLAWNLEKLIRILVSGSRSRLKIIGFVMLLLISDSEVLETEPPSEYSSSTWKSVIGI